MTKRNTRRGFTLIELLVVVLIIGILAAVALPQYQVAVAKSRLTQALILGDALWNAQRLYYMENGQYAENIADLDIDMPSSSGSIVQYKGGYCQIQNTQLYCTHLNADVIFVRFYFNTQRICRNNTRKSFGRKVCLGLGGTTVEGANNEDYLLSK